MQRLPSDSSGVTADSSTDPLYLHLYDMDGCLYNMNYLCRLLSFFKDHRHQLYAAYCNPDQDEKSNMLDRLCQEYEDFWCERFDNKWRQLVDQPAKIARRDVDQAALNRVCQPILKQYLINVIKDKLTCEQLDWKDMPDKQAALWVLIEEKLNTLTVNKSYFLTALELANAQRAVNWFVMIITHMLYETDPSLITSMLVDSNPELFKQDTTIDPSAVIAMLGSNRQSRVLDNIGRHNNLTTSALLDMANISVRLGYQFEALTMTDVSCDLPDGTTHCHAANNIVDQNLHFYDRRKISLIYLFFHYIASQYPERMIHMKFKDDLDEIVEGNQAFFSANPHFLPRGAILEIYHYNGHIQKITRTVGTGLIDIHYRHSIKLMADFFVVERALAADATTLVEAAKTTFIDDYDMISTFSPRVADAFITLRDAYALKSTLTAAAAAESVDESIASTPSFSRFGR